jgi:hypothetical protein
MEYLETRLQTAEARIIEFETENRFLKEQLIAKNSRKSSTPPAENTLIMPILLWDTVRTSKAWLPISMPVNTCQWRG